MVKQRNLPSPCYAVLVPWHFLTSVNLSFILKNIVIMFYSKNITVNMVKINESNARLEVLIDVTTEYSYSRRRFDHICGFD